MRTCLPLRVFLALIVLVSSPALARAGEAERPSWETAPAAHRGGLAAGLTLGLGVGGAKGYPNDVNRIGDPRYYASSGFGLGGSGSLLLMGALTDYLSCGLWFGSSASENGSWRTSATGGGIRVEVYPFYQLYPALRDLGLDTQLGIGITRMVAKRGAYPGSDATQSYASLGAFYEWSLFQVGAGHLALGPTLDYAASFSHAVDRHAVSVGGRLVLYTAR